MATKSLKTNNTPSPNAEEYNFCVLADALRQKIHIRKLRQIT